MKLEDIPEIEVPLWELPDDLYLSAFKDRAEVRWRDSPDGYHESFMSYIFGKKDGRLYHSKKIITGDRINRRDLESLSINHIVKYTSLKED